MLATAVTLAIIVVAVVGLVDMVRYDRAKIIAALQGRSWTADPRSTRPAIVRFSPRCTVEEPELAWPALRAAA